MSEQYKTFKTQEDVGMAYQKVRKQGRDDITVQANLQSLIPTSFSHKFNVKRCRDSKFFFPTLFSYLLACHFYILLHWIFFYSLVSVLFSQLQLDLRLGRIFLSSACVITTPELEAALAISLELHIKLFETNLLNFDHMTTNQVQHRKLY